MKFIMMLFFLLLNIFLYSEVILLIDNSSINGEIKSKTDDTIIITKGDNDIVIKVSEVKIIFPSLEEYNAYMKEISKQTFSIIDKKNTINKYKNEFFYEGLAISLVSNSSLLFAQIPLAISAPYNALPSLGFLFINLTTSSFVSLIPTAGPLINSIFNCTGAIASFALTPFFGPGFGVLGALGLINSVFQLIAFIYEKCSLIFANKKYEKETAGKISLIFDPVINSLKFNNISVAAGISIKI